jgi:flagellar biosynthesis protein FlhB
VAFSRDLTSALAAAAAVAALMWLAPAALAGLLAYQRAALLRAVTAAAFDAPGALATALETLARTLAWPLTAAATFALAAGLLQTRGLVAPAAFRFDLGRASPSAGWRRLAGGGAALGVARGLLGGGAVAAVAWVTLRPALGGLGTLAGAPAPRLLAAWGELAGRLAGRLVVAGLLLGALDGVVARRRHRRGLRMTRDEIKRELEETEGDSEHRAERRRLLRNLGEQRMVADAREADFVVAAAEALDSGAIAVALRYERGREQAPVVVAKGARLLAARISQVAREAGVPVFNDGRLARSLNDVGGGQPIPPALYAAVAEILRVVYRDAGARRV